MVVEAYGPQFFVIVFPDFGRVFRELHDIIEHDAFLRRNGRGGVVAFQGRDQFFIEGDATQKLCVRLDSINAPVGHGNHGRDHLVMTPLEREIGRHQSAECREGMLERLRN